MPRWIHYWQDTDRMTTDDMFSESLADRDQVTDDEPAWQAYLEALAQVEVAFGRLRCSLRGPTLAERNTRRAQIKAFLEGLRSSAT